jgi:hypothetical protein
MAILQGWKVKFYTFVTFLLFIIGAAVALWPRNPVHYNQDSVRNTRAVKSLTTDSKEQKQPAASTPDGSAAAEDAPLPLDDMTDQNPVLKPVPASQEDEAQIPTTESPPVTVPGNSHEPEPEPQEQPDAEKPRATQPITKPVGEIVCPLTASLLGNTCKKLLY